MKAGIIMLFLGLVTLALRRGDAFGVGITLVGFLIILYYIDEIKK
jgi:hypothetical protein